MRAIYFPDRLTPLPEEHALRAIRDSFRGVLGEDPSVNTLALLAAQCALETGRWKACHWNNWGNVKASISYEGHYTCFRLNELIKGKYVWFSPDTDGWALPPGHPQTRMRAYQTSAEGATAHLKFLWGYKRYAQAWKAALRGDPNAFVVELKNAGYFTAHLEPYLKAVESLTREYRRAAEALKILDEPVMIPAAEIPVEEVEPDRSALSDWDMHDRVQYLVTSGMARLLDDYWDNEFKASR